MSPVKHSLGSPEISNLFKMHSSLSLKVPSIHALGSILQGLTPSAETPETSVASPLKAELGREQAHSSQRSRSMPGKATDCHRLFSEASRVVEDPAHRSVVYGLLMSGQLAFSLGQMQFDYR